MASLRVVHLRSTEQLRAFASPWDNLWSRSTTILPTARADVVAHWVDRLADGAPLHAIGVESDGRWLAAIPLVESRLKRVLKVGRLPCNEWAWAGDLLLERDASDQALDRLIDALFNLSLPLLWFDGVPLSQPHWQRFLAALDRRGRAYSHHERFRIGIVDLNGDWDSYETQWSSSHRRQMRKMVRRAEELGGVTLDVQRPTDPKVLERVLQTGFEVEDRSWKGRDGTSVLKTPVMHEYLCELAGLLAEMGHLELRFLMLQDRPIAFEYGLVSKGCYFSPKVGYDEDFAHLSPGQLLRLKMMEPFFQDADRTAWDFLGPLVPATERWTTGSYAIERLVVASGASGRFAVRAYRDWWPTVRRLREQWQTKRAPAAEAVSP
jgi:CelD/BcsL family acetyltransferase involved in cellulose biosynthesis